MDMFDERKRITGDDDQKECYEVFWWKKGEKFVHFSVSKYVIIQMCDY